MLSALLMGAVVCTALSMAGSFITDLKIGYWIGTTPKKQETFKFLGTIISAATVAGVMILLNKTYGFTSDKLAAPQAHAMAAVIAPLMNGQGAPWLLYAIGAVIALILDRCKISALAFHLAGSKADSTLDDAPAFDNPNDTRHGDTSDADITGIMREDILWAHRPDGSSDRGIPLVEDGVWEDQAHQRYDYPPHGERSEGDNGGISQPDDISQPEHGGTGVDLEHQLSLVGQVFPGTKDTTGEVLIPPSERGYDEVVQTTDYARKEQGLGLVASFGTAHQHLRSGCRLRERIFPVHVFYEILTEGNQEKDAQHAS